MLEFIAKLVQHTEQGIVDLKALGGLHVKESQLLTEATRIRMHNHVANLLQGVPILEEITDPELYKRFITSERFKTAVIMAIYQHNDELTIKFKVPDLKEE